MIQKNANKVERKISTTGYSNPRFHRASMEAGNIEHTTSAHSTYTWFLSLDHTISGELGWHVLVLSRPTVYLSLGHWKCGTFMASDRRKLWLSFFQKATENLGEARKTRLFIKKANDSKNGQADYQILGNSFEHVFFYFFYHFSCSTRIYLLHKDKHEQGPFHPLFRQNNSKKTNNPGLNKPNAPFVRQIQHEAQCLFPHHTGSANPHTQNANIIFHWNMLEEHHFFS